MVIGKIDIKWKHIGQALFKQKGNASRMKAFDYLAIQLKT